MDKKPFLVAVREVHVAHRRVFAHTADEAITAYANADTSVEHEEVFTEFSHFADVETWTAEAEMCDPDNNGVQHCPDWTTIQPAEGAYGIIDVKCSICGTMGSFKPSEDVNW